MTGTSPFFPIAPLRIPKQPKSTAKVEQEFYETHGEPVPGWLKWIGGSMARLAAHLAQWPWRAAHAARALRLRHRLARHPH